MGKRHKIRIGSRGSALALSQVKLFIERLSSQAAGIETTVAVIKTAGDRAKTAADLQRLMRRPGGQGVFVKEIDQALLRRKIDAGVHSLKDVPGALLDGLCIGACLPRAAPNDLFIGRDIHAIERLHAGAIVGTSSPRRRAQLKAAYPALVAEELRGNLDTRLAKLADPRGRYDGIIVSAAAFRRLSPNSTRPVQELSLEQFVPAPGQGTIAIVCRERDEATRAILARVNDESAGVEAATERALLTRLQAGCSVPLGALARTEESGLVRLVAMVADPETGASVRGEATGEPGEPDEVAAAVESMLKSRGSDDIFHRLLGGAPVRSNGHPARRRKTAKSRKRR